MNTGLKAPKKILGHWTPIGGVVVPPIGVP